MADKKASTSKADSNVVSMAPKKAAPKKAAVKKAPTKKLAAKAAKKPASKATRPKIKARAQAPKKPAAASQSPSPSTNPLEDIMMKNTAQFDKMAQEAADLSRQSFEAMTQSYGIFAKGYENLMRTTMEISQNAAEKQAAFAKEAMSCSSMDEFKDMQSKVAQTSLEDLMSGATKLSEISTKVLTESAEPLSMQMNKTMQKMKTAA